MRGKFPGDVRVLIYWSSWSEKFDWVSSMEPRILPALPRVGDEIEVGSEDFRGVEVVYFRMNGEIEVRTKPRIMPPEEQR